MQKYKEGFC